VIFENEKGVKETLRPGDYVHIEPMVNTLGGRNRTKSIGADQVKNLKHEVSKYSQT
jgi:hypothetical protein